MKRPGFVPVIAVLFSPCISPALAGQDAPSVATGNRVRIKLARDLVIAPGESTPPEKPADTLHTKQIVGQIVEMDGDTLTITLHGRSTRLTVPRDAIARMDLSRGRPSAGERLLKGAGIGLLVGGMGGALLGLAYGGNGGDCPPPPESTDCIGFSTSDRMAIGGIVLGTLGAVVGGESGSAPKASGGSKSPPEASKSA
jgi:hypothetical protein